MNKEIAKDFAHMQYAELNSEQLKKIKELEDEINTTRKDKIYLMAFVK